MLFLNIALSDAMVSSLFYPHIKYTYLLLPEAQHLIGARVEEFPKPLIDTLLLFMQCHVLLEFKELAFKQNVASKGERKSCKGKQVRE
ncbi:TPA: hypothetical protein KD880_003676 [Vibrio parahaemolyticus]|nr:hypothetical protein [Vibrio parahaemolyticus]HBC3940141.1 hypothetical protein [Vibrio parahaemolyticus]